MKKLEEKMMAEMRKTTQRHQPAAMPAPSAFPDAVAMTPSSKMTVAKACIEQAMVRLGCTGKSR